MSEEKINALQNRVAVLERERDTALKMLWCVVEAAGGSILVPDRLIHLSESQVGRVNRRYDIDKQAVEFKTK